MTKIISRDEYLAFRDDWKREYMKLSSVIRALKVATRLASKAGYAAAQNVAVHKQSVASVLQSMRAKESNYAHFMMDELEAAKDMARVSVCFKRWMNLQNS